MRQRVPPPRWMWFAMFAALALVLIVGVLYSAHLARLDRRDAQDRREANCERWVVEQEKDRAMWLWLADYSAARNPDDAARAEGIRDMLAQLDKTSPPLYCPADAIVPVEVP